jgi:hypothetical protein
MMASLHENTVSAVLLASVYALSLCVSDPGADFWPILFVPMAAVLTWRLSADWCDLPGYMPLLLFTIAKLGLMVAGALGFAQSIYWPEEPQPAQ